FAFYPGTGLPDRYTNHFFICDFPGGVWSLSLKPRGASFELAAREKLLWNLLPTHCAFGPDGALYVSDWVEGWSPPDKGRLYRVSDPAQAGSAKLAEAKRLLADGMAKRPEAELARLLAHNSMQVRLAAQFELAARTKSDRDPAVRELVQVALKSTNLYARLHAMWGLGQISKQLNQEQLLQELSMLLVLLDDSNPLVRGHACRLFQQAAFGHARDKIARRVGDSHSFVQYSAAIAFAKPFELSSAGGDYRLIQPLVSKAADALLPKLDKAKSLVTGEFASARLTKSYSFWPPDKEMMLLMSNAGRTEDWTLFQAGSRLLMSEWQAVAERTGSASNVDFGWQFSAFATNTNYLVRRATLLTARRLNDPALALFLRDPDPRLVLEAARAINDAGIEPAYPALAALLPVAAEVRRRTESALSSTNPPPHVGGYEAILRRALNAHYRLGHATNAQALADFAAGQVGQASSLSSIIPTPAPAVGSATKEIYGVSGKMPDLLRDSLRAEALFLLSAWEVQPATPGNVPAKIASVDGHGSTPLVNPENWPGWFDRVCGLWRPLPPRAADDARAALRPHLASLLAPQVGQASRRSSNVPVPAPAVGPSAKAIDGKSGGTPDLLHATQLAAIAAVEKLALTEAAPHLAELVKTTSQPAPVRVASLRTLGHSAFRAPHSALLSAAVTLALADTNALVRREAVKLAAAANPTAAVPLLARVLTEEKDFRLRQAALTALGDLPGHAADTVLTQQLALLTDKKLSPELHLELLEAAAKRPSLAAQVGHASRLSSNLPVPAPAVGPTAKEKDGESGKMPDLLHEFRPALAGGDATEGKRVFHEHAGAQCLRCHAVRGEGGIVGPALNGVSKRLTREQLLESIVRPNATIAAGFENATLVMKGGTNHSGLVKSETATELVLDSPEDGKLTLKKADIEKRIRGLSAMPEGVDKLMTRRELRDLVEYLSGLK
ncbi:MAG: hypothetical protein B9S33_22445, partial [Pedosphaera sp. Tous-C6FEB]